MKKLIFTSLMMLFCAFVFAQQTTPVPPQNNKAKIEHPKQVQNPAAYACPKCFNISKGAGNCEHCQVAKVQLGTYYCAACNKSTGSKPGKCPSCGATSVQMTRKLCSQHVPAKKAA
jgi:hypothetical protein